MSALGGGQRGAPPFGRGLRDLWALDPDVLYLNHGTVGATPRRVLAAQGVLRDLMERQPARFLLRETAGGIPTPGLGTTRMRAAAERVARFVGASPDGLVFVDNATSGANAVLRSLLLSSGDELVVTDHGYGAVTNAARFVARRAGAVVRTATLPYPDFEPARAVDAVVAELSPRTRLVIVDHVTAESALLLPVEAIVERCRAAGVPVMVDGAHVPGALPLDVRSVGADFYVANLHKWAWSPRSAGFLWVTEPYRTDVHPPVISWGLDQGLTEAFDWVGTRDPTPWLAAPEGIAMLEDLGFDDVVAHNRGLAWEAGGILADRLGARVAAPRESVGTMVTVLLPERYGSSAEHALALRNALLFEDGIEVQVHAAVGRVAMRVSAQVYVEAGDVVRLADAVAARAPC